jgi:hypothetical protein
LEFVTEQWDLPPEAVATVVRKKWAAERFFSVEAGTKKGEANPDPA